MSLPVFSCVSEVMGPVSAHSVGSGRTLTFDRAQVRALSRSWQLVEDRRRLGTDILLQVFTEKPALMRLFFSEEDMQDLKNLQYHASFIKHADTFSMFLHITVTKLITGESIELVRMTHQVGRAHATIHRVRFDAEYWLLFKKAVIDQMEPFCQKAKVGRKTGNDVWNKFVMFLIMEMKFSFNQHTLKRLSCPDLSKLFGSIVKVYQDCESEAADEYQKPLNRAQSEVASKSLLMTEPLRRKNGNGDQMMISRGGAVRFSLTGDTDSGTDADSDVETDRRRASPPPPEGVAGSSAGVLSVLDSRPRRRTQSSRATTALRARKNSLVQWFRPVKTAAV